MAQPTKTATCSNVSSSASSVNLLAANSERSGLIIHNDSSAILYVKYGATASTTSYTRKLAAGEHWETELSYNGVVDGIWASANGAARITEISG